MAVVRRYPVWAAASAAASCLALLRPVSPARATAWAPWATAVRESRPAGQPLAGCEQRLERDRQRSGPRTPVLAIVGASFTAGVGPGSPGRSWAMLLARRMHWDTIVYGDPGAGYVRAGAGWKGPVADEITRLDLRALAPALVIVQAGHDDIGVPPWLERQRVEQAVTVIRAEAPHARIALVTVFAGRSRPAAAYRTDRAIVTAGIAADRQVIIMDPLAGGWTFARSPDGPHPSAAGSAWIAREVAVILRDHGVFPVPPRRGAVICDTGIPAPAARTAAGSPR